MITRISYLSVEKPFQRPHESPCTLQVRQRSVGRRGARERDCGLSVRVRPRINRNRDVSSKQILSAPERNKAIAQKIVKNKGVKLWLLHNK